MYYKTDGIILSQKKIGEADKLLSIFTKDRGKVSCIAKGARKPLSRKTGHIELGNLCELYIAEGKNLDILTEATLLKSFSGDSLNIERTNMIYHLLEIMSSLTVEHQKSYKLFNLLLDALTEINNDSEYKLTSSIFKVKLLSSLGFFSASSLKNSNAKKLLYKFETEKMSQLKSQIKLDDKSYHKLLSFLDNMIENLTERNLKTSKFVYG